MKTETELLTKDDTNMPRRSFLRYAGAGVATVGVVGALASCTKTLATTPRVSTNATSPTGPYDIGSGDVGILNYAYALEQLEAAFYIQVVSSFYTGATADEMARLTEIRDHEVLHRNFFKAAIPPASILPDLTPDFSKINFADRTAVLTQAKVFEDLGVTAYDGVGSLIQNPDYLTAAGKIVSVEARHAAYIANLLNPGTISFVGPDQVDASTSLNITNTPATVLTAANMFLITKVTAKSFGYSSVS